MTKIMAADRFGTNTQLMQTVEALGYFDHRGTSIDVTWGRGKWWKHVKPPNLIAHDKYTLDGVDYLNLPERDGSVTLAAFDPPYISPGGRTTSTMTDFNNRYGVDRVARTPHLLDAEVERALRELWRVLEPGGIVLHKTANYITSGKLHLSQIDAINSGIAIGFKLDEMLLHVGNVRAQPSGRKVRHARQNVSYLLVWRKPGRRPRRSAAIKVVIP